MFERECRRINIKRNQYAEVLRLFMDGSGTDWYCDYFKTGRIGQELVSMENGVSIKFSYTRLVERIFRIPI